MSKLVYAGRVVEVWTCIGQCQRCEATQVRVMELHFGDGEPGAFCIQCMALIWNAADNNEVLNGPG